MATLICGSLAFDTIMSFEGRFAEQILPDQLHILNVSFLVPSLRRDFGGCAGNIAYAMRQLGGTPLPVATLGNDGGDYLARLRQLDISTEFVRTIDDTYTAQAMIMTDRDNNQITAFHPGAMMQAHRTRIAAHDGVPARLVGRLGHGQHVVDAGHAGDIAAAQQHFFLGGLVGRAAADGGLAGRAVEGDLQPVDLQALGVDVLLDRAGGVLVRGGQAGLRCGRIRRPARRLPFRRAARCRRAWRAATHPCRPVSPPGSRCPPWATPARRRWRASASRRGCSGARTTASIAKPTTRPPTWPWVGAG